jgi:biotin synthase
MRMQELIDKLYEEHLLSRGEFCALLDGVQGAEEIYLFKKAQTVAQKYFGNKIYIRGLIEFTSYCKNDCYYCGIRRSNQNAERYRLTEEQILSCCQVGYALGFRTFVLQGGEDPFYTDEKMVHIVSEIHRRYSDCAITLSIGEKEYDSYRLFREAGAERYLLRHETANPQHYRKLHPPELSLTHRKRCLSQLKTLGYQVGAGFMVGSPFQTTENLAEDLLYIHQLNPQMVGIGPFVPHHDTPFANFPQGSLRQTLHLLSILRLMQPNVLLPATTALGTIHPEGRELGILAGANVVMPNLSPVEVRKKYALYDNKLCTGEEAAECRSCLQNRMRRIGYEVVTDRGDYGVSPKALTETGLS